MYNKYPYTDFHELNLDWFLSEFKKLKEEWETTSGQWDQMQLDFQTLEGTVQTFTTFVENYFENLDVQDEINHKLDQMASDGSLAALLAPLVDDKLPDVIDTKLPGVVDTKLPAEVTTQLPGVVADQIDAAVAPEVPPAVTTWLNNNVDPVGSAVMIDSTLSISGSAADAKVVGDDIRELQGAFDLVEGYNKWYIQDAGKYIKSDGTLDPNVNYDTGPYTSCIPGDTWHLQFDYGGSRYDSTVMTSYNFRFVCFFDSNQDAISAAFLSGVNSFVIPAGAAYFRCTIPNTSGFSNLAVFPATTADIVAYEPYYQKLVIKENNLPVNVEDLKTYAEGISKSINSDNAIGSANTDTDISIIVPMLKKNINIGYIGIFTTFDDLYIYQGKGSGFNERICKITSTDIELYKSGQLTPYYTHAHGLTIADYISVLICEKNNNETKIYITSNGGTYTTDIVSWAGCLKMITAEHGTETWTNVLSWGSADISERIWIFGDSYLDHWAPQVTLRGYSRMALVGYSGGNSQGVAESFNQMINMGKPQTVVWCLGMNDPDSGAVNSDWLSVIEDVKDYCNDNGIHLIVQTIPNTPLYDNSYKNTYIKSHFDYIDVAELVGSNDSTSWYNGLLSNDNVHPSVAGDFYIANIMQTYLPDLRNS